MNNLAPYWSQILAVMLGVFIAIREMFLAISSRNNAESKAINQLADNNKRLIETVETISLQIKAMESENQQLKQRDLDKEAKISALKARLADTEILELRYKVLQAWVTETMSVELKNELSKISISGEI